MYTSLQYYVSNKCSWLEYTEKIKTYRRKKTIHDPNSQQNFLKAMYPCQLYVHTSHSPYSSQAWVPNCFCHSRRNDVPVAKSCVLTPFPPSSYSTSCDTQAQLTASCIWTHLPLWELGKLHPSGVPQAPQTPFSILANVGIFQGCPPPSGLVMLSPWVIPSSLRTVVSSTAGNSQT